MALSDRVAKHLAKVGCPLKPLAEPFYSTIELLHLCDLHTHEGKKYIHVHLHKFIRF